MLLRGMNPSASSGTIAKEYQSPPGPMRHFQACAELHGGFCCNHELADYLECLTYNLCAVCREWKSELPVLFQFEASVLPDVSWCAFLGRVMGEDKLAFLSCANFLARGVDQPYDAVELAFDDDVLGHMSVPVTSHRLF